MNYNFLTPSQLPYPGQATTTDSSGTTIVSGSGGYQMPVRDGLLNSIFTPDDLPYPLPAVAVTPTPTGPTATTPPTTTPPTTTPAPCACCTCPPSGSGAISLPVVSTGGNGTPSGGSSTPSGSSPSAPAGGTSAAPSGSSATTPSGGSATQSAPASSSGPSQIIINVGVPAAPASASASASGASDTSAPTSGGATAAAPTPGTPAAPGATATAPQAVAPATVTPFAVSSATRTPNLVLVPPVVDASSGAGGSGDDSAPSDVMVRAYSYNPRLRARTARAQDQLLEDMLDENITNRMFSSSAPPIAFVVPDGYDTVDFYVGAIEVNPCHGEAQDLDLVVTLGEPKVNAGAANGQLHGGDQISVVVPWRYASWVELAAEHLRVAVTARFSASEVLQPL
jgi:hypothetical protein